MMEYSFIAEEKINVGEQNINNLQTFDSFSHMLAEDFVNMTVRQTNKYATDFIVSLKNRDSIYEHIQTTLE